MRHLARTSVALFVAAALMLVGEAAGYTRSVDLGQSGARIEGGGWTVSGGGDVNGDGQSDFLTSDCDFPHSIVYVVFGPIRKPVDIHELGDGGFEIISAVRNEPGYCNGTNVADAGDINGDGLDDVIVGDPAAANGDGALTGNAYVVFGKQSTTSVDLETFDDGSQGSAGFRVAGDNAHTGEENDLLGDVNHDGLGDFVVLAGGGSVYVIFGQASTDEVDLGSFELGIQGFKGYRIDFPTPESHPQSSVAGAGDVKTTEPQTSSSVQSGSMTGPGWLGWSSASRIRCPFVFGHWEMRVLPWKVQGRGISRDVK